MKNLEKLPDPRLHKIISFVKSGVRILGYLFIPFNIGVAVTLLVVSEGIGIVEELVLIAWRCIIFFVSYVYV